MPVPSTTHTVRSSDGTRIGVHTLGSGPPVVLVHGAWNWAEHWMDVAEQLADAYTCSVMDRRARGSSGDHDEYSFDREIDDVAAVLEDAGPDSSLLGHSSGAIYALETPVGRPSNGWSSTSRRCVGPSEAIPPVSSIGSVHASRTDGSRTQPSCSSAKRAGHRMRSSPC